MNFESSSRSFPAGCDGLNGTNIAWSSHILPYLEETALFKQIDFSQPWNAPGPNLSAAQQNVPMYICPSASVIWPGMEDYGGIQGTSLLNLPMGNAAQQAFGCGVLITTGPTQPYPVAMPSITDGTSYTLSVGESVDRDQTAGTDGWASGFNCFSQNVPTVNIPDDVGNLYSRHPAGANGLFVDGHVVMLDEGIASSVLVLFALRMGANRFRVRWFRIDRVFEVCD